MKQIIEGLTYNTETAEMIDWNEYSTPGDFRYVHEALYKTKKGRFFLAGKGGALSKYSRSCGNNGSCGGSGIIPLDPDEALAWCEQNRVDPDIVTKYFKVEEA